MITLKSPLASVVPTPITPPVTSRMVMVEFGSALPITAWPASTTSKFVGAAGGVISGAIKDCDAKLFEASVAIASIFSALTSAGLRLTEYVPSAATTAVPKTAPVATLLI